MLSSGELLDNFMLKLHDLNCTLMGGRGEKVWRYEYLCFGNNDNVRE